MAPCHHHQAVEQHPGYVAAARDADGVLQAMEGEGEPFRVGVQWHPETSDEIGLFSGLVAAAAAWARGRADAAG
jgi:putative glutamine amidotransferase